MHSKPLPTTVNHLPAAPLDWPGLAAATLSAWHQRLHLFAGVQRVTRGRLCLGSAWADAGRHEAQPAGRLHALAQRLARDGVPVDVLVIPGLAQPELHLGWAPWHAPPPGDALRPRAPDHTGPNPHPTPGEPTMKVPFIRTLLGPRPAPAADRHVPDEPALEPVGVRSTPGAGKHLQQALAQMADQIAAQEVHDLLDTVDCRYQLWTLTLWVTAANQHALRLLVEVNRRDDGKVAKAVVERGFAKAEGARLLNTLRLKLEFKRGDSLPHDASEVLVACGRDNVALPFSYTGQIELGEPAGAAPPIAAGAAAVAPAAMATPGAGELLLWAQLPGQAVLKRWRFRAGTLKIGADEDATVAVEHRQVSGEHLSLSLDDQGRWQVEDRSRNGACLFDASLDEPERPLPTRKPQPLPRAGALRLGPLPHHPLLNFQVLAAPAPVAAASTAGGPGARRRTTQLAGDAPELAAAPPPRATGLL